MTTNVIERGTHVRDAAGQAKGLIVEVNHEHPMGMAALVRWAHAQIEDTWLRLEDIEVEIAATGAQLYKNIFPRRWSTHDREVIAQMFSDVLLRHGPQTSLVFDGEGRFQRVRGPSQPWARNNTEGWATAHERPAATTPLGRAEERFMAQVGAANRFDRIVKKMGWTSSQIASVALVWIGGEKRMPDFVDFVGEVAAEKDAEALQACLTHPSVARSDVDEAVETVVGHAVLALGEALHGSDGQLGSALADRGELTALTSRFIDTLKAAVLADTKLKRGKT